MVPVLQLGILSSNRLEVRERNFLFGFNEKLLMSMGDFVLFMLKLCNNQIVPLEFASIQIVTREPTNNQIRASEP